MKPKSLLKITVTLAVIASFFFWNMAVAAPQGGTIAQGSAVISNPTSTQTVINQASQNTVVNWNSFNTAQNESVVFNQPNSSSIALNRINSGLPTNFAGSLTANGQVWILNSAGVLFTSTAKVDVAGLLVTTHNITDSNFMSGNYQFTLANANSTASVINNGSITIENSGIAALVAPNVVNNGIITANLGKVSLSTGSSFVLDLYGDNLINFGTNAPILNGSVSNTGIISATGGKVYMTANTAAQVVDNVISMSGVIQATTATTGPHGEIILNGGNSGTVNVSGTLNASNGGHIETSGNVLVIEPTAVIDAGQGGSWLIDPANINITTSSPSTGITPNNLNPDTFTPNSGIATSNLLNTDITSQLNAGTSVIITTTNSGADGGQLGIITVSAPVLWTTTASLTLDAANNIAINAAMGGTNAVLVLNSGAAITQTAGITANTLTTSSVTGTGLTSGSAVSNFNATNTNSGNISFVDSIASLAITGLSEETGGTLTLINSGNIIFNNAYTVTGNSAVSSTAGSITFDSTIDDATAHTDSLTISTATDPTFSGAIGGTTPLNTLAITEPSITIGSTLASIAVSQLNAGTNMTFTSTSGNVTLSSPITQTVNTNAVTLTLHAASNVNLNSTITMLGSTLILEQPTITFNSALDTFVEGQLSAGTSVELDATTSPITIAIPVTATSTGSFIVVAPAGINLGANVSTGGSQTYSSPVRLTAEMNAPGLTSTSGNITFGSTVDGAFDLALSAVSGSVIFNGVLVGGTTPLRSLIVTGGIAETAYTYITTTGNQNYFGNISAPVWDVTSNSGNITFGTSGSPITVNSTYFVATANSGSVTVNGNITAYGAGEVGTLTITAPEGIFLNSNTITTAYTQDYVGPVTLENNLVIAAANPEITFTSSVVATANQTLEFLYGGSAAAQPESVTFDGPVGQTLGGVAEPLGAFTTELYRVSSITFKSTLDVSGAVDIETGQNDTPGTITFDGAVGSQTPPTSFNVILGYIVNGADTEHIKFMSSLVVNGPIDIEDSGSESYLSTVEFNGAIGTSAIPATSLFVASAANGAIDINSGVSSPIYVSGTETYQGPVLINNNPAMQFNGTSVTIENTLDSPITPSVVTIPGNLILSAGGSIGQTNPLNSLLVDGTSSIGGNITTVNNQTYTGNTTLNAANLTLISNGGGNISFGTSGNPGTVNGADVLNINPGFPSSSSTFWGAVGNTTALTSLTTTGTTNINGGAVTTTGAQNYNNAVILGANTILTSTAGGALNFNTIDSNGTPQSLTLTTSALVTLNNNVGINSKLNSLTVTNGVDIGGNIHTVNNQLYSGAATLITNNATPNLTTLTSDSGNITFSSTLNGAFNLATSAASGTVFFDNIVGGTTPLSSLAVTGAAVIGTNDTSITTTGTQVFNESVTLTTPLTEIFEASSVTFDGAVSGTSTAIDIGPTNLSAITNLIVGTSGSITAKSLFVSGTTLGPNVTTTNGQVYTGAVTLNTNETYMDSSANGIKFDSTVDGGFNLIIDENGASNVTFDGNVGGATPLASLVINGSTIISGAAVINTNNYQTYNSLVTLNNNIVLSAGTSGCTTTNCVEFTLGTIGVNGITGPGFDLSVFTYDASKGSTGAGIAGTVNVAGFTMGGTGGGNISPLVPDYSTVGGSSAVGAWNNTKIDPAATGLYCVNGYCISGSRVLTITSSDDSKTYGQTFTPTLYTTSGLAPGDSITSLTLTSLGDPATAPVSGSPYAIDVSNASGPGLANHYTSITYDSTGLLTVNPASLTITADDVTKTYGQIETFTGGPTEFTVNGLLNSDTVTSVTLNSTGAPATAPVSGSPYDIIPSAAMGTGLSNYTITYSPLGTLTVNPAPLTITSLSQTKPYGENLSPITSQFITTGLQNGETIGDVTITSLGLPSTAPVGNYAITDIANPTGGTFNPGNYAITFDPAGDIFVIAVNTIMLPTNVPPTEIFIPPEGPGCGIAGCDNTTIIVFDPIGGLGFPPDIIVYPAGNSGITGVVSGICGNLPIAVDEAGVPRQLHIGSVVYKKDTVIADQHSCTCIKTNSHETKCTHDTKHNPQWTAHCETCQANHFDNNHHVKSNVVPAHTLYTYSLMNVLTEMKNKIVE